MTLGHIVSGDPRRGDFLLSGVGFRLYEAVQSKDYSFIYGIVLLPQSRSPSPWSFSISSIRSARSSPAWRVVQFHLQSSWSPALVAFVS